MSIYIISKIRLLTYHCILWQLAFKIIATLCTYTDNKNSATLGCDSSLYLFLTFIQLCILSPIEMKLEMGLVIDKSMVMFIPVDP